MMLVWLISLRNLSRFSFGAVLRSFTADDGCTIDDVSYDLRVSVCRQIRFDRRII